MKLLGLTYLGAVSTTPAPPGDAVADGGFATPPAGVTSHAGVVERVGRRVTPWLWILSVSGFALAVFGHLQARRTTRDLLAAVRKLERNASS